MNLVPNSGKRIVYTIHDTERNLYFMPMHLTKQWGTKEEMIATRNYFTSSTDAGARLREMENKAGLFVSTVIIPA